MIKRIIYAAFVPEYTAEDLHENNMFRSLISEFPEEFIRSETKLTNARNKSLGMELSQYAERYSNRDINPDLNTLMYGKSSVSDQIVMTIEI